MNKQSTYQHAVVIGGSIAGLAAARVLTDYCERVTIIERDTAPLASQFRKGVPQARHPHILLKGGERALEGLFPGLRQELFDNGALPVNMGFEMEWFFQGQWREKYSSPMVNVACSRPLLESAIHARLRSHPKMIFIQESEVVGLLLNESKTGVAGVRIRSRRSHTITEMEATIVVDASGRDSDTPRWLEALGFPVPAETSVTSKPGYATRIYAIPESFKDTWKAIYIQPSAPNHTRGAVIVAMEGNRWHVTMCGMAGDYPPTTEESFLEFAKSLPDPRIYEAIKDATPLSPVWSFRRGENRLRHYDQLSQYLEGFLVFGDAVYALNPVYGQGMTVAALGAMAMDKCLREQQAAHPDGDLSGLAECFQKRLATVIAGPWQMATGEDRRWNVDENVTPPDFPTRMMQNYMVKLLRVALIDKTVSEAFFQVQQMTAPPTLFFQPNILWRVLSARLPVAA
ncbi:MAG TPA: FAD-dependent monooxygenase [Anaerolineales bacterium]|nr:FAD-dependent monooxygenase [Anaerolineales bacterium]